MRGAVAEVFAYAKVETASVVAETAGQLAFSNMLLDTNRGSRSGVDGRLCTRLTPGV